MTDKEKSILKDKEYWEEIESNLGWKLHGFTYQQRATYIDGQGATVSLTGRQRDDIKRLIDMKNDFYNQAWDNDKW